MSESFDYLNLAEILIDFLKKKTKLDIIESDSVGPQLESPFITYSVISPYIPITVDIVDNEQFECVLSLTIHEKSKLKALNLSERLRKLFQQLGTRQHLQDKDIIVVSTTRSIDF